MAQIRADKKTHEQTLAELARRAEELQALLQRLEKLQFTAPFPLISLGERKGRLSWPTTGRKILQGYGLQRHPQFNTVTMNNGIEIAPRPGDLAVRAVQGGRVAFADRLPGYGNLIIIDHGYGYHSLYGHCAEFLVKAGDFVRPDQPIGHGRRHRLARRRLGLFRDPLPDQARRSLAMALAEMIQSGLPEDHHHHEPNHPNAPAGPRRPDRRSPVFLARTAHPPGDSRRPPRPRRTSTWSNPSSASSAADYVEEPDAKDHGRRLPGHGQLARRPVELPGQGRGRQAGRSGPVPATRTWA